MVEGSESKRRGKDAAVYVYEKKRMERGRGRKAEVKAIG